MDPDETNVAASNIIDKFENRPSNLHFMYLADFTSSYVKGSKLTKIKPFFHEISPQCTMYVWKNL